jgi:hypothetical protein
LINDKKSESFIIVLDAIDCPGEAAFFIGKVFGEGGAMKFPHCKNAFSPWLEKRSKICSQQGSRLSFVTKTQSNYSVITVKFGITTESAMG